MLLIVFAMLFGWVNVKTRMIIWKLEWLKVLFKLTTKREVDTALLEYNFFDYFFQVLFVNVTFWILLSILLLTLFSDFNISVSTTHLKYYNSQGLTARLKLIGGAMKYFLKKLLGVMSYIPFLL